MTDDNSNDDLPDGRGAPKGNTNAVKHGLFTSTERFLEAIDPSQKAMVWELYDELLGESIYDFDVRYGTFDLGDDYGVIEVPTPTTHIDQALSLFNAAVDAVKMTKVNAELLEHEMETTTVSHAQLDKEGNYKTIEENTEHYLNIAYSRLVRDRKELLEHGGVGIEETSDETKPDVRVDYFANPLDTEPTEPESIESEFELPSIRDE